MRHLITAGATSITKSNRRWSSHKTYQIQFDGLQARSNHWHVQAPGDYPSNLGHSHGADGLFKPQTLCVLVAIISKLAAPGRPKGVSDVDAR
jgi:hypothetical protein